jgi:hypothetical protein
MASNEERVKAMRNFEDHQGCFDKKNTAVCYKDFVNEIAFNESLHSSWTTTREHVQNAWNALSGSTAQVGNVTRQVPTYLHM